MLNTIIITKKIEYKGHLFGRDYQGNIYRRIFEWPTKLGLPDYNAKPHDKWIKVHHGSYLKATIAIKLKSV